MRRAFILVAIMAAAVVADAAAQAVQRPSRPSRGLFGGGSVPPTSNRTRQELTLTASILGGYEDFVVPASLPGEPVDPSRADSAYTGTVDGALRYWRGRTARSFSVNTRAYSSLYSLTNIDPALGANLDISGSTQAGRKNTISATQVLSYEPSLAFGAYGPLTSTVASSELPEGSAGSAFLDQRSWSSSSALSVQRRWTTRQTMTGSVTYVGRRFLNDIGYNSDTRAADGRYSLNVRRTTDIDVAYRYSLSSVQDPDGTGLPVKDQTIDAGLSYSRRLSQTRQIHFSGGTGATFVQTQDPVTRVPLDYWTPSGRGMVRLDLGRTWAVGVDYRRAVSVLPGITLQSFATNAASLRANGRLGNRIEMVLSGAFSNGRAGYGEQPSRYESYSGNAQLHFAFSRCCATTINYDYYYYQLHQVTSVATGIPNQYDRNSLRVGVSVWVPLFGTFASERGAGR